MFLENGRSRSEVVDWVIAAAAADPSLVAGFDFAFSLPAWYCRARGWATGPEVWAAIAADAEALLHDCPPPFWGRPGIPRPHPPGCGRRRTEREDAPHAKSVFQIGGAGAVGTGSLRGMKHLLTLRDARFTVWPFEATAALPMAVEIYPRAMYGPSLRKRRGAERIAYLRAHHGDQDPELLARAAASEDAFDAAVSALAMSAHVAQLAALAPDPDHALEGRVWIPTTEA